MALAEVSARFPSETSFRSLSSAQEKVSPFYGDVLKPSRSELETALAILLYEYINQTTRDPLQLSIFTDLSHLKTESEIEYSRYSQEEDFYDFPLSAMPKSVERVKVTLRFSGKGKPNFDTDLEID